MWQWLFIGLASGVCGSIPAIVWWSRRTAQRVRLLESRARDAERLAEQATLTGGLAHEIKNPLSTIGLNLQLIHEQVGELDLPEPQGGRLQRRLDALSGEVARLRTILEDFLRYAGQLRLDRQPVEINTAVEELVDFFTPQAQSSGVNLRSRLDPNTGQAPVDITLFKQAVLNLLINATQAMVAARYEQTPHGGAVDLIITTEGGADAVAVHVIDTGPGISDAKLDTVFKPYYSTKRDGSGLGLPTSRRIVESHGGRIEVHSEPGKGSDFTLHLPRHAET